MHHALIVARLEPGTAPDVARIFAASDRGELPQLVGVTRRRLFHFGDDLYLHLIESDRDPAPAIARAARHPEFRAVSDQLSSCVRPYDPATWRGPKDAMARCFYRWDNPAAGT
ncbi:TcmI family type II polyketide cyclase [Streptomyces sp. TRM 70361]|uniref:TcmI family type II polyketide cyclase n=1 Tax=Streptomyces sp. TRM 70361 TaxID=3116553 RepID=UPI002E7AEC66|nr:TcmI family type II polyketide cyclase [Streptomyces sp. TRM 70361]MEE1940166.1 TcmI family type II polyketide cyclase [Streptomyces sp. TRM 70361]